VPRSVSGYETLTGCGVGFTTRLQMGNHEQSLIWYIQRNHDSAKTTIGANVPEISAGNLSWIQTELRLYYETQGYIFVHAGIDSKKALSQTGQLRSALVKV